MIILIKSLCHIKLSVKFDYFNKVPVSHKIISKFDYFNKVPVSHKIISKV